MTALQSLAGNSELTFKSVSLVKPFFRKIRSTRVWYMPRPVVFSTMLSRRLARATTFRWSQLTAYSSSLVLIYFLRYSPLARLMIASFNRRIFKLSSAVSKSSRSHMLLTFEKAIKSGANLLLMSFSMMA